VDAHYPQAATITIVLDNHSSKETLAYLATRPGREYVHTPKHPWLNLIESACANDGACFRRRFSEKIGISYRPSLEKNRHTGEHLL